MNKEVVEQLIVNVRETKALSTGFMSDYWNNECNSPGCLWGHVSYLKSKEQNLTNTRPTYYGSKSEKVSFIAEELGVTEEEANNICWPEYEFTNFKQDDYRKRDFITKTMVLYFLNNLLKGEGVDASWWLASERVEM